MSGLSTGPTEMQLLASAADGMRTQRAVLDLAARNVAAAQASTPHHPYARLVAQFRTADAPAGVGESDPAATDTFDPTLGEASESGDDDGSAIVGVRSEPSSGDALGEMIAVLDAQRAYEQNASIFDTAKRLAERTIDIGRA